MFFFVGTHFVSIETLPNPYSTDLDGHVKLKRALANDFGPCYILIMDANKTFQFENATVVYTNDMSAATGKRMPRLYVQAIDAYGFQREWTLQYRHEPGDSSDCYWESHAYHHPGRRDIQRMAPKAAARVVAHFLDICQDYPTLMFNASQDRVRARHEGFVKFHEVMLRGFEPSVKMM